MSNLNTLNTDLLHSTLDPVEKALQDNKIDKSQISDIVLVDDSQDSETPTGLLQ